MTLANQRESIEKIRAQIDVIDMEILALFKKREQCVLKLGEIKRMMSKNPVYYDPKREQIILEKVKSHYKGKIPTEAIVDIFKILISHCRLIQEK